LAEQARHPAAAGSGNMAERDPTTLTDLERRYRNGESKLLLLTELYRKYNPVIRQAALRKLAMPADADDVVLTIDLKMEAHFDEMIRYQPVEAWIRRVTGRHLIDLARRRSESPIGTIDALPDSDRQWNSAAKRPDGIATAERRIDLLEPIRSYLRALLDLGGVDEDHLAVLWRSCVGYSQTELAELRGVSQSAVSQMIKRVGRLIRQAMYVCQILGTVRRPFLVRDIVRHVELRDRADALTANQRRLLRFAGEGVRLGVDGILSLAAADASKAIAAMVGTLPELHAAETTYAEALPNPYPTCILRPCAMHPGSPPTKVTT
jgi:RNA polymerase sigma factor (sigma-70 family)